MKNIKFLPLAIAAVCVAAFTFMAVTQASAQTKMVRLTRFEGKAITGVNIGNSFAVDVIKSESTSAVVEVPASLEEYLIFKMEDNGTVTIKIDDRRHGGFRWDRNRDIPRNSFRATIYTPVLNIINAHGAVSMNMQGHFDVSHANIEVSGSSALRNLDLSAAGNINMECSGASSVSGLNLSAGECRLTCSGSSKVDGVINSGDAGIEVSGASHMDLRYSGREAAVMVSGSSKLDLNVDAATLMAEASGASRADIVHQGMNARLSVSGSSVMNMSGNTEFASVDAAGASSFRGEGYHILRADLTATSGSSIRAEVEEELSAKASGASGIYYNGSPRIIRLESTTGSYIKKQ